MEIIPDWVHSEDVIAFIAVWLAYLVYRASELSKFTSWRSLLKALKSELEAQSAWVNGRYSQPDVQDIWHYDPSKIVFRLSFESAVELLRRGSSDYYSRSADFERRLAEFNERIDAFNGLLEHQSSLLTSNPVLSNELQRELGMIRSQVGDNYALFSQRVLQLRSDLMDLAQQVKQTNNYIHSGLIGDTNHLHLRVIAKDLHAYIAEQLGLRSKWYFRIKWILFLLLPASATCFIGVEWLINNHHP